MKKEAIIQGLLNKSVVYLKRNSSTILSFLGTAGIVATAVSVTVATTKAVKLLDEATKEKGEELTKTEVVAVTAKTYIPSVIIGASTIACVLGANVLNKRQQASLVSAYALAENMYKEYRGKVRELLGEETDIRIQDAIVKEKCKEQQVYVPGCQSIDTSGETRLFYEQYRDSYFESTMEAVLNAEYHLNRNFSMRGYAELNEFYDFLGLEPTKEGSALGWDCQQLIEGYEATWIDFDNRIVTMDDGLEVCIIDMPIPPVLLEEYF